jgi:hypothetical protein
MEPSVTQVIERVTGGQPQRVRFLPPRGDERADPIARAGAPGDERPRPGSEPWTANHD